MPIVKKPQKHPLPKHMTWGTSTVPPTKNQIVGTVDEAKQLPEKGLPGDMWLIRNGLLDKPELVIWTDTGPGWQIIGPIKGVQGSSGVNVINDDLSFTSPTDIRVLQDYTQLQRMGFV